MLNIEQAIYKAGSPHIQTSVRNGFCDFTSDKSQTGENLTVDEYLAILGPEFACIPIDDAVDQCQAAQDEQYIGPWEEITEENWDYWLEVLPPQKWKTVNGVNLFQLSELTCGIITRHCARVGDRCFTAQRKVTDSYEKLAQEIKEIL